MDEYTLSKRARKDLLEIGEYTKTKWSEEQAVKYLRMLFAQFRQICRQPRIGCKYDHVRLGLWTFHSGKHLIFYRVLSKDKIRIVRILHERMDFQRHL
ncbi:MAG: type II toxin-antitoxin system RelE/ParE family toxin [Candidatus Cryptobacteroides sp.]